jgi:fructoselysine 6-kinase
MTRRLTAVGDNCLDVYLTYDRLTVGGNALNVAAQWHRNGWDARYFGAVGNDPEGDIVLDEIAAAGLSVSDIEGRLGSTGVTLLSHESGDRSFLLEDLGVGERFEPADAAYAEIAASHWVHLGTNSSPELVRRLVADRVQFSVDISTAHGTLPITGVPLVFASGPDSPDESVEPLARELRLAGAQRVVITCGNRGAYFSDGHEMLHEPATEVDVLDTCGAGDSFIATFLTSYCCDDLGPAESLRRAAQAAGQTCTHLGGFPQQPRAVPDWLLSKYAEYTAPILDAKGS